MQPLLHYVCYAADGIMTSGENVSTYVLQRERIEVRGRR